MICHFLTRSLLPACSLLTAATALYAQSVIPEIVPDNRIDQKPYRFNGMIETATATGSASLIGDGIIATAAHVIYDTDNMRWEYPALTDWIAQHHEETTFQSPPADRTFSPLGFKRWTSYAERVQRDIDEGMDPSLSRPDTFNADFAIAYLNPYEESPYLEHWAEVHVDREGEVGILRDPRIKTILGYPADTDFVDQSDIGFMHQNPPEDYFVWWYGITDIESTWTDSAGWWQATYDVEQVGIYSGNSGGPVYVRGDQDQWLFVGAAVGGAGDGNGNDTSVIRAFDEEAMQLLTAAADTRGNTALRRVRSVTAEPASPSAVRLQWSDNSTAEDSYRVLRTNRSYRTEVVAVLPADQTTFTDTAVQPGNTYHYAVQPEDALGNRPATSKAVTVQTPGFAPRLAQTLNAPALALTSSGQSNWHPDGNRLRSGQARSMGHSSLTLDIRGPGTLSFSWSVSSEENPDYPGTDSQGFPEEIYDALYLYLNGERVMEGDQPVFISGSRGPLSRLLDLPQGQHTVEWRYLKDPYTQEGEDAGFLHAIGWIPEPANPAPVYAATSDPDQSGRYRSAWMGDFHLTDNDWIAHTELGWLYPHPTTPADAFLAYSPLPQLGWIHTSPELFPYLYQFNEDRWLRYQKGSGSYAANAAFIVVATGQPLTLP